MIVIMLIELGNIDGSINKKNSSASSYDQGLCPQRAVCSVSFLVLVQKLKILLVERMINRAVIILACFVMPLIGHLTTCS